MPRIRIDLATIDMPTIGASPERRLWLTAIWANLLCACGAGADEYDQAASRRWLVEQGATVFGMCGGDPDVFGERVRALAALGWPASEVDRFRHAV